MLFYICCILACCSIFAFFGTIGNRSCFALALGIHGPRDSFFTLLFCLQLAIIIISIVSIIIKVKSDNANVAFLTLFYFILSLLSLTVGILSAVAWLGSEAAGTCIADFALYFSYSIGFAINAWMSLDKWIDTEAQIFAGRAIKGLKKKLDAIEKDTK